MLVSPDGALVQLPWGRSQGEKLGSYLLKDRSMAVFFVPQMLLPLQRNVRHAGLPESPLLAGDIELRGRHQSIADHALQTYCERTLARWTIDAVFKVACCTAEMASIKERYVRSIRKTVRASLYAVSIQRAALCNAELYCDRMHRSFRVLIQHGRSRRGGTLSGSQTEHDTDGFRQRQRSEARHVDHNTTQNAAELIPRQSERGLSGPSDRRVYWNPARDCAVCTHSRVPRHRLWSLVGLDHCEKIVATVCLPDDRTVPQNGSTKK